MFQLIIMCQAPIHEFMAFNNFMKNKHCYLSFTSGKIKKLSSFLKITEQSMKIRSQSQKFNILSLISAIIIINMSPPHQDEKAL